MFKDNRILDHSNTSKNFLITEVVDKKVWVSDYDNNKKVHRNWKYDTKPTEFSEPNQISKWSEV